jgi:hypothetical protein
VVARHLGRAPIHWLTTYVEETMALPPAERGGAGLRDHLHAALDEVRDLIDPADHAILSRVIRSDRRLDPDAGGGRMASRTITDADARLADLRAIHAEVFAPGADAFYATLRSNETVAPFDGEGLVGLLTFPNSGTSWFLRLSSRASGICNHTCYAKEVKNAPDRASRGAYAALHPGLRLPRLGEPSFVKSHVRFYGPVNNTIADVRDFDRFLRSWRSALPPNCDRHVRLVRDPLDNLRARYHHHLKTNTGAASADPAAFRLFFRADLRRYLHWHAFCDALASTTPVMTIRYETMLDPVTGVEAVGRAMRFAGHRTGDAEIRAIFDADPPKYVTDTGGPVHLRHFSEEDIRWAAAEMRDWLDVLRDIRSDGNRLVAQLRRLVPGYLRRA